MNLLSLIFFAVAVRFVSRTSPKVKFCSYTLTIYIYSVKITLTLSRVVERRT